MDYNKEMKAGIKTRRFAVAILCVLLATAVLMLPAANAIAVGKDSEVAIYDYTVVLKEYDVPNASNIEEVVDPNGEKVTLMSGKLFPLMAGDYTLKYVGGGVKILRVFRSNPKAAFTYDVVLQSEYPMGEYIAVPKAEIVSEMGTHTNYNVAIACNGQTLTTVHSSMLDGFDYLLEKSGDYTLTYSGADSASMRLGVTDTVSFTVTGDPAVTIKNLPSRIYYGETLDIGGVYGLYNDNTYAGWVEITLPSGEKETLSDLMYTPAKSGVYTFTAKTTIDGNTIEKTQQVEVVFSANSLISSAYAVDKIQPNVSLPSYSAQKGKAMYVGGQNSTAYWHYSKIIDLREKTKKDTLIEFLPYSGRDSYKWNSARVTLIDAHNASNQIALYWWYNSNTSHAAYMSVYVNGKEYGGICNEPYVPDLYGKLRTYYGTVAADQNFNAYNQNKKSNLFNLRYDISENAVYSFTGGKNEKVIDLDDPAIVGPSNVWGGFTTGEVYLKFEFTSGQPTIGMYVYSIDGNRLDYDTMESAVNDTCFMVKVPDGGRFYDGVVGYEYAIPEYFVNTKLQNISVTFGIYKGNEKICENAASFTPSQAGTYKAVYSAVDNYGSTVKKEYSFTVHGTVVPFTATLPTDERADMFEWYKLPDVTQSISGGVGKRTVSSALYCGNDWIEDEDGYCFIDRNGSYSVKVTVVDSVGYKEVKTYPVLVNNDYVSLVPEIDMISVRAGETVTFPSFETYDYKNKTTPSKTLELYVNGTLQKTFNGSSAYTYAVPTGATAVTLKYYAGKGTAREKVAEKNVAVLPSAFGKVSDYLIYDKSKVEVTALREGLVFATSSDTQSIKFPNPMPASAFKASFGVNADSLHFSDITLRLTDAVNPDIVADFKFFDFNTKLNRVSIEVNGQSDRIYTAGFNVNTYSSRCHDNAQIANRFKNRKYYALEGIFDIALNKLTTMTQREMASVVSLQNGRSFSGFTSGLVFAEFILNGVTEKSEIIVSAVANQGLNFIMENGKNRDCDNSGPSFLFASEMNDSRVRFGEQFVVLAAKAYDLIQRKSTDVSVTVTAPDNSVVYDGTIAQSKAIRLNRYGLYKITYSASDAIGNKSSQTFNVTVADTTPPTVTVSENIASVAELGATVSIPSVAVSDDVTQGITATVYVRLPDGKYVKAEQGGSLKFEMRGTYYIIYSAQDENGNLSRVTFTVTVG